MRHDWVFEVLTDLAEYAEKNGLPRLARKAAEALAVARDELRVRDDDDGAGSDGTPSLH